MMDHKDYDIKDFSKEDEKYLNMFKYIKDEIYSILMNLPPVSRIISFRDDKDMVVLEYLIYNDKEKGIINNIFTKDDDNISVTTHIVTFKNKKFLRNVTLYSDFFKENGKEFFEMYSAKGMLYSQKEIKKEEIKSK